MQATASGMLSVYFYDTLAGSQPLEPTTIAARANPQVSFSKLPQGMLNSSGLKCPLQSVLLSQVSGRSSMATC